MTLHTHSRVFGTAKRQALAIHCTLAHCGAWRGMGDALGDDLSLLAMDMASHGKSGDWDGTGNLHDVVTDMARGLMDEPIDVIGHSFGATVALRLAVESPELVRSITMIEPVYFAALLADDPDQQAGYDSSHRPFADAFASGDTMKAARVFNRDWGDGTRWDDIPQTTRDYMAARMHFVIGSSAFIRDDSSGLLANNLFARATMPGVLVHGGTSPPVSAQINASLARRMPQLEVVEIENAGHMAPLTHPAEVAKVVRKLIARC